MNRKKELKQLYKAEKKLSGVFRIKNTQNQKVFIKSSTNLKSINGQQFQLNSGCHPNKMLQKDWQEFGKEAFILEILEVLELKEDEVVDVKDALEKLEIKWVDRLKPFGEHGYN